MLDLHRASSLRVSEGRCRGSGRRAKNGRLAQSVATALDEAMRHERLVLLL